MTVYNKQKPLPDQELLDSLTTVSLTHGLILRGTQADFARLQRTLNLEFPDLFLVYKVSSVEKCWIKKGEPQP